MITGTGQGIWTPETAFNQRSPTDDLRSRSEIVFFHGFKMRRCAVAAWLGPFCVAGISHRRVSGLDLPEYGVYARFHHAVEGTATQVDRHHANFENPCRSGSATGESTTNTVT
jgi:hypothetical protein